MPSSARRWTQSEIDREFFAIVTDQIAAPAAMIEPDTGEVAGRSVRTLYGETAWTGASTPWSYPGQYLDTETGLHYNRHRYYHPSTGRYLSSDPLGLAPAPNPHGYPANPSTWADPLGLAPTGACNSSSGPGPSGSHEPPDLDALSESGRRPSPSAKNLTVAGHNYQKHMNRPGSLLEKVGGRFVNEYGHNLLDDILTSPGVRIAPKTGGNFQGGTIHIAPNGHGAVFDEFGNFQYFGRFT